MKTLEIIGFKRANLDSAALNEIRDSGNVPCVVYGPGILSKFTSTLQRFFSAT